MGYHGFDIVNNKVATRLHADADSFKAQIKQGVLDTNAEALLLNGFAKTVKNTGEIFARANELGIEWIAIHDLNDPILDRLKLSDDVCAHINHDLSGGYIVLSSPKNNLNKRKRAYRMVENKSQNWTYPWNWRKPYRTSYD